MNTPNRRAESACALTRVISFFILLWCRLAPDLTRSGGERRSQLLRVRDSARLPA
jgi:hypothetical protein